MKKFSKILLSIFLIIVLIIGGGMIYITRGLESGKSVAVNTVNASTLSDGIYNGKYEAGRWTNEVKVSVKDGKITAIDVVEDVIFPKPEWTKALFNNIIEKQSIDVDVVSGSTVTSKAYMKSIEDALNNIVKK
jgi:uncharacterized protein with FMN-binding domain